MHLTKAAVLRATFGLAHRVFKAPAVIEKPSLGLEIQIHIGPIDIFEIAVLGTGLLHHHPAVFLKKSGRDNAGAFRAYGRHLLGKTFLYRRYEVTTMSAI
jgi:hypothetical protein